MNPSALPHLMVTMAKARRLDEVLGSVVAGVADCANVALARIWLFGPGDRCASCPMAAHCEDRSRCLHLVASAGNPRGQGERPDRLDGAFSRFPVGARKIGRIAATGEPMLIRDLAADSEWICVPSWVAEEGIVTFAGEPLVFRGEVLGVMALFDRGALSEEDLRWFRTFADHAAVSIANARAFEEIESLRSRLEAENQYLRGEVAQALGAGDLLGQSPGLAKVRRQIELVAPTDAAVLITGESGTGKELVARALHDGSPRRERSLVKVNCGAIPETLFESEFFGHAKGAFTGALRDKPGRFEVADGGTLFLDEIGELLPPLQSKLLRVLQEQEFERVGESKTRKVDVRIVAATNRDLRGEVDAGRFRRDLYYRLSVFPIDVPPLRERPEDIAILAGHFAARAAARMKREPSTIAEAALRSLETHDWPGNVRELQNVVERAVILSRGSIRAFDLPPGIGVEAATPGTVHPDRGAEESGRDRPLETRADWRARERVLLTEALERSGGKIFGKGGAAEILGMKPTTLASRIKALGLRR